MIPFPHVWAHDPRSGIVRCFKVVPALAKEPKTLRDALTQRMRSMVCHVAVSGIEIDRALMRIHGWGEIDTPASKLLTEFRKKFGRFLKQASDLEDAVNAETAKWDETGSPDVYSEARRKCRLQLATQYPDAPRIEGDYSW